ncbi:cadherin-like beta sandwich domain-containing protein [Cohnella sp. GCM10027633]|uniref:cadherin-like beta sandwich domain-containing protein n=1 Tax=unclassified Cohnella TaxID=2636738 RepID=UPI003640060A
MRRMKQVIVSIVAWLLAMGSVPAWFGGQAAYAASNDIIWTAVGTGAQDSYGDGDFATAAAVNRPAAIAFDSAGNLYIAEGARVRRVDKVSGRISTFAGLATAVGSGDGGPAVEAKLVNPSALAFDGAGNLYIADWDDNRVRKIDMASPSKIITTVAGTGEYGYSGEGIATSAQLNSPSGLAFDGDGNLYIADAYNDRIRKVDTSGIISTFAGSGIRGYSGDGGAATDARLDRPSHLAFDGSGNLYIADMQNYSVRKVDKTSGKMSTVMGKGTQGYAMDGAVAADSHMGPPSGLAFDSLGNMYVSEGLYSQVRKIDTSGIISTVAGISAPLYGGDGGLAIEARINFPLGLAVDGNGKLYIADSGNNRVRRLAPSNNANLSSLTLSDGDLFDLGTTSYKASIPLNVSSITITPTVSDADATVTVGGTPVTSGTASGAISVSLGVNTPIPIVVTALDGTTKTYDLTLIQASQDASLSGLATSSGSLTFDPDEIAYWVDVGFDVSSITVTPTPSDPDATVTLTVQVGGINVTRGPATPVDLETGTNIIDIDVIAADTLTTFRYVLFVRRALNDDASLSGLTLSSGSLSPAFATGTTGYSASVANGVSSITVTPTTSDSNATIKVKGVTVARGTASGAINLNVGANAIPVVVTAQDGSTTETYTVTVTRAPSSDATLSGLTASSGSLSPAFVSGTTGYSISVANGVSSITLTPTTSNGGATVTVDGHPATSGSPSAAVNLSVGANAIPVVVTAQDGTTTETYTVTVTRAALSSDASLSGLTVSSGSLSPAFASGTTGYAVGVANGVSSITVTPTVNESNATVTVDGAGVTSGTASGAISLNVGANAVPIVVTAQDGTTSTYTVTVTRAPSTDASLSGLTVSSGSLSPAFASGTTGYAVSVANGVSSITVTPTTSSAGATVTVDGNAATSGTASAAINLSVGTNTIPIVVTAQDGTTTGTYTVTVTRAALSSDASLSGLTVSNGSLSPAFASGMTGYAVSVANGVSSLTVTPTVNESNATVTVDGTGVTSGTASGSISLNVGANAIPIVVTAQDGTTSMYTVTVTRAAAPNGGVPVKSNNADLSGLSLSGGSLSPSFASGTTSYTAEVAHDVSSVTVSASASHGAAKVKVGGTGSGTIPLSVGANSISVAVTAEDGTTTKTYGITVTRAEDKGAPPKPRGPILNEKLANVLKVIEEGLAALQSNVPQSFSDVPADRWSYQAIQVARQLGIVQGRDDGSFHGTDSITRAEFVAMVAKALRLDKESDPGQRGSFADTQGHWAESAIEAMTAAGVIEGVGAGAFQPNRPISRAEISAVLARLIVFDQTSGNASFSDAMDSWARPYIERLAGADIVKGSDDGRFHPNADASREEAVMMILRMLTVCRNVDLGLVD